MDHTTPEIDIIGIQLIPRGMPGRFLAYFDCDFGYIQVYGCYLSTNERGEVMVSGPVTAHKGRRAVFISGFGARKQMLVKLLPMFRAAGGLLPKGAKFKAGTADGGELDEYLR